MSGFIEGEDRSQATLFPERINEDVEDSAVRVIDVFVDELLFCQGSMWVILSHSAME